jgi:hypothetical protein
MHNAIALIGPSRNAPRGMHFAEAFLETSRSAFCIEAGASTAHTRGAERLWHGGRSRNTACIADGASTWSFNAHRIEAGASRRGVNSPIAESGGFSAVFLDFVLDI